MKISLHFSSAFTTLWEKWPRARGERKCIGISNRSQLICMANASLVVKSKMGHLHLHTHPLQCRRLYRKLPQALQAQFITRILKFAVESQQSGGRNKALSSDFRRGKEKVAKQNSSSCSHAPGLPLRTIQLISAGRHQDHQGKKLISTSHTLTYPSQQLEAVTIGGDVN